MSMPGSERRSYLIIRLCWYNDSYTFMRHFYSEFVILKESARQSRIPYSPCTIQLSTKPTERVFEDKVLIENQLTLMLSSPAGGHELFRALLQNLRRPH